MDYLSLLIGFLLLFVIGFLITNHLIISAGIPIQPLLVAQTLVFGVGIGITSTLIYLWINISGTLTSGYFFLEIAFALFLVVVIYLSVLRKKRIFNIQNPKFQIGIFDLFLVVIFLITFGISINIYIQQAILKTRGGWDAWAFWNLNAEFIIKGGELWKNLLWNNIPWANPDYPLLLSSNSARLWLFLGRDSYFIPMLVGGLFWLSTISLLITSVIRLRGLPTGLASGIVLLAIPLFTYWSAQQYADIPLSYFFLSTFISLILAIQSTSTKTRRGFIILAGIAAGYSPWVKNEGWLFILSFLISLLAVNFLRKTSLHHKDGVWLLIGMLPGLLTTTYHKVFLAPSNDVMGQGISKILSRLFAFDRYYAILKELVIVNFDLISPYATPLWVSLILIFLFGINRKSIRTDIFLIPGITMALVLIGYFFIFVISPHDIVWHTETALNRLLLQLWPSVILMVSLLTNPSNISTEDSRA